MQNVIAIGANAVNMIDSLGESAVVKSARVLFHKLFESVLVELLVFHVEILVFLHIGLVLEGKLAATSIAMEMGGFLAAKGAVVRSTIFAASESEESLALDGIVFPMVIKVHLNVRSGDVHLVTMS